jgi:Family of unknown function (DUF6252)
MKKLILLLMATLLLSSCSKDDNPFETPTTPDTLPPATTVGANKVGCLINGEVFLPKGSNPFGSPIVTCYYQNISGGFQFGLRFSNNQQPVLRSVNIYTNKLQFVEGQTYNLNLNQPINSAYAYFILDAGLIEGYSTDIQNVGQIKITKLDEVNAIISGTFWFNAIKASTGEVKHITEGRFDMQYTQ